MDIFAIRLTEKIDKNLFETLLLHIHESKRLRIRRFFRQDDAHRALIGDILARVSICNALGINNTQIIFSDNGYGKPLLKDYPDYHFSISHAGNLVVYAAHNRDMGIDVEKIRPVDFKIAERFFNPAEYHELMGKPENEKLDFFYDIWTLKESYIKAIGRGLGASLRSFCISIDKSTEIRLSSEEQNGILYFKQYCIDDDYKLSVCSLSDEFAEEVVCLGCDDLIKEFMKLT